MHWLLAVYFLFHYFYIFLHFNFSSVEFLQLFLLGCIPFSKFTLHTLKKSSHNFLQFSSIISMNHCSSGNQCFFAFFAIRLSHSNKKSIRKPVVSFSYKTDSAPDVHTFVSHSSLAWWRWLCWNYKFRMRDEVKVKEKSHDPFTCGNVLVTCGLHHLIPLANARNTLCVSKRYRCDRKESARDPTCTVHRTEFLLNFRRTFCCVSNYFLTKVAVLPPTQQYNHKVTLKRRKKGGKSHYAHHNMLHVIFSCNKSDRANAFFLGPSFLRIQLHLRWFNYTAAILDPSLMSNKT